MKPNNRIAPLAFLLALLFLSTGAWALPSACSLRCSYPNTCHDSCVLEDEETWTTCEVYRDGCGPTGPSLTSEGNQKSANLCAEHPRESRGVGFDFLGLQGKAHL
jgi:hypothetical protein